MKYCQDEGQSHFLKPWAGRDFSFQLPAGETDLLFLLARGEPNDFVARMGETALTLQCCAPCTLGPRHFRWMEATLPAHAGCRISLAVVTPEAALAVDQISHRPVLRVSDASPPEFLTPSYQEPSLPAAAIHRLLPSPLNTLQDPDWLEVWALSEWVHRAWEYRNTHHGTFYCPWRIEEILHWGRLGKGPEGEPAIAMCVHYAVAFQQCCLALGTPARLIPLMPHPNGENGHFVAEFWSRSLEKWILIDPQSAVCYLNESGQPLNALEVSWHDNPVSLARCGSTVESLIPLPDDFPHRSSCKASLFRHIGVWRWADFFSHPEHGASGHGTTAYAETAILWLDQGSHPPMFPYALTQDSYLAAPPTQEMLLNTRFV